MFTVRNKEIFKSAPPLYPQAERKDPTIDDKGWDAVDGFKLRDKIDFIPQKGMQERFVACNSNLIFLCGESQMGKAQPYDAKVLTPSGFVAMGDLQVGNIITGADGKHQCIEAIYEQGEKEVYRVVFEDGASTECCDEHLWSITHAPKGTANYGEYKVCSLGEIRAMINSGDSVAIPLTKPVVFDSRYKAEWPLAPVEERIHRLFVITEGAPRVGVSCHVAEDIMWLARSLGKLAYYNRYTDTCFIDTEAKRRRIIYCKKSGIKPCRCIKVSNSDSLYITDDFIVTHNTYGMFLKALNGVGKPGYTARFISVRLQDSKKGGSIFRDAVEVCGNFANCQYNASDYPTFTWPQWNNAMQLIHSNFNTCNPSEWGDFKEYAKKNQASYICVDEATDMRDFKMFAYWFSRNRDSSGMTPQMVLSFNFEHEHFTTTMLKDAGYIGDDWYFKPEMNGVTRYFYIKGDDESGIIWGDTPEQVAETAGISITEKERKAGVTIHQIVKSFTALTGESADNLKLIAATGGQNIGNLHATGATSRAILKCGYAGPIDNENLGVNRAMIHALWQNPVNDDESMYATLDVSRSVSDKSDDSPMIIWKGLQIVAIEMLHVDLKTLVGTISNILSRCKVPVANFAFDGGGIGEYLQDFTLGNPIKGNRRPVQEYDQYGNPVDLESYFDLRSQLHGKTEAMFKRGDLSCIVDKFQPLKYGKNGSVRALCDILFDEINVFASMDRNGKTYYKNKKEYKAKFKSSPDLMDAIVMRAFFELDARPKKQASPIVTEGAYDDLLVCEPSDWGRSDYYGDYNFRKFRY